MDLQQLRYVVAVAEEASFTRAAARCFVAQSGLSHQIKSLEDELGVVLFHRTSRRVELSAAGGAFLAHARAALKAADRAAVDAAAAAGRTRGQLRVGVIPTVTAVDVPEAVEFLRARYPDVHLALSVAGSDELEQAIGQGEMDVAFLGLPEGRQPRGVAFRHLGSDRLVAIVSRDHPLAPRDEVSVKDLANETFADFPTGTPARLESDLPFARAHLHRNVAFESMATEITLKLIRRNLAVTLLPPSYVPPDPTLIQLPVRDGPVRSEYLAWSKFHPSPAARAFIDIVADSHHLTDIND